MNGLFFKLLPLESNPKGLKSLGCISGEQMLFPKMDPFHFKSKIPLYQQESNGSLVELFAKMSWDDGSSDWDMEADLKRVILYVRGSKLLRIPPEWRKVIPHSI